MAHLEIPFLRSSAGAYALALLCAAVATALSIALDPYVAGIPFVAFFPAVVITAMLGGLGAGLFCVVLSVTASIFFEQLHAADVVVFTILSSGLVLLIAARNQAERKLLASKDRLQFVLDAARIGWWEHDIPNDTVRWDGRAMEILNLPEMLGYDSYKTRIHPDDREWVLTVIRAVIADPLHSQPSIEYRIQPEASKIRWINVHWLVRIKGGLAVRIVGTVQDITERKEREVERMRQQEKEQLLMREINHRAKNMLSVVHAIAHQTATRNPEDFIERFSERIQALSANQNLLVRNEWNGVEIGDLVRAQLAHFADLIGSRIAAQGAQLYLNPASAQTIGLAIHELATNAGKYGALSTEMGRVDIFWGIATDTLTISWTERNGPPVSPPRQRGFGSTVIEAMVEYNLNGTVCLDYARLGLTWRLICPAASALEPGNVS